MAQPLQRPSAPWSDHNWWGQFDDAASLPNVAAASFQVSTAELQRGDVAWAETEAALYYCDVPTEGAAVWMTISSGGGGGPPTGAAGGDLGGTYPNPNVVGIQGDAVATGAVDGQILKRVGGIWTPSDEATAVLEWGQDNVSSTVTTRYLAPGWDDGLARVNPRMIRAPRSGVLSNLYVVHQTPRGNGGLISYTLRVNAIPSVLSASLSSTAPTGDDTVSSVPVAAGDFLDIEVTKAASVGQSPLRVGLSMEFV